MRDIPLLLGFAAMLPMIMMRPHVGVLAWCWTALLVPNVYVYGIATGVRFNFWIAIFTLLAWMMSKEAKRVPMNTTAILLTCYLAWGTLSTLLTISPDSSTTWVEWEKFIKTITLALVVVALMRTETRIKAVLFAVALSLGFDGVIEALKFILSGGGHKIWGPGTSIIADNNHFAVAIIMTIPIMIYLYMQSRNFIVRSSAIVGILLLTVTVIGTGSRGGVIGVVALAAWIFITAKKKLRFVIMAAVIGVVALSFAPAQWHARMSTIETADQDASFMGRVIAWKINTLTALDNPLTGAGFRATQELAIWLKYAQDFSRLSFVPTSPPDALYAHSAHSIYFQVLGDMGFAGLAIFLALLATAWRNASLALARTRELPEMRWANHLARTLQYCLIPYIVSGAALNLAYFDLTYVIFALLAVLREETEQHATAGASMPAAIPAVR
jgi:probable O-glycosylation ligase (exosortase A-associated)